MLWIKNIKRAQKKIFKKKTSQLRAKNVSLMLCKKVSIETRWKNEWLNIGVVGGKYWMKENLAFVFLSSMRTRWKIMNGRWKIGVVGGKDWMKKSLSLFPYLEKCVHAMNYEQSKFSGFSDMAKTNSAFFSAVRILV